MNPIAILQHDAAAAPGYFSAWLEQHGLPYRLFRIDRAEPVPADPSVFSGLCLLGGEMSVNDALPWIGQVCALIRQADAQRVPVIGHCLGGQLLAKAFGARVQRNDFKEIGWSALDVSDHRLARRWLGTDPAAGGPITMFQWHGDTFDLPADGRNFLASKLCPHQAFVIERDGFAHLGMQFHCEMTPALVQAWAGDPESRAEIERERARNGGAGVQSADTMTAELEARIARMHRYADNLYRRWSEGLRTN